MYKVTNYPRRGSRVVILIGESYKKAAMMTEKNLQGWIHSIRKDARERDGTLIFSPLPLFVLFAYLLSEKDLFRAYAKVESREGCLDPEDDEQTKKLEGILLEEFSVQGLKLEEFLSIDWEDAEERTTSTLLLATIEDYTVLILYHLDETPSFQAVAMGSRSSLQNLLTEIPELVLPRLSGLAPRIREVRIFTTLAWTEHDLQGILYSLIGVPYPIEAVMGAERLVATLP